MTSDVGEIHSCLSNRQFGVMSVVDDLKEKQTNTKGNKQQREARPQ
jgi:hypothetical protein